MSRTLRDCLKELDAVDHPERTYVVPGLSIAELAGAIKKELARKKKRVTK